MLKQLSSRALVPMPTFHDIILHCWLAKSNDMCLLKIQWSRILKQVPFPYHWTASHIQMVL
jgi:hypothetical protein